MEWIKGENNSADLGTKNLDHASHAKHIKVLCCDNDKISNFHLQFGVREGITRQQSRDLNTPKIVCNLNSKYSTLTKYLNNSQFQEKNYLI